VNVNEPEPGFVSGSGTGAGPFTGSNSSDRRHEIYDFVRARCGSGHESLPCFSSHCW
jgi:hypothetical protein